MLAAMTTPAPSPYTPPAKRYMRLVPRGAPLVCPHGHRIREDTIVLEHAGIRCKERSNVKGECGALLWVLLMIPSGWRFVAEVNLTELRHMQTQALDVDRSLRFLGLDGPLMRGA